jgi:hypothetical protein
LMLWLLCRYAQLVRNRIESHRLSLLHIFKHAYSRAFFLVFADTPWQCMYQPQNLF